MRRHVRLRQRLLACSLGSHLICRQQCSLDDTPLHSEDPLSSILCKPSCALMCDAGAAADISGQAYICRGDTLVIQHRLDAICVLTEVERTLSSYRRKS